MAGKYVFSTLTGSHKYPIYVKVEGRDMQRMQSYVLIHGGANLPSKVLVTPKGVMTHITDEEFTRLEECPAFKRHVDRGFLTVEDMEYDIEEVAGNMETKDTSAPMVPEDFEEAGIKPPTTAPIDPEEDSEADFSTVRATQRPAQAKAKATKDKSEKPKTTRRGRGAASA